MSADPSRNTYLEQVVQQTSQLEEDLRVKRKEMPVAARARAAGVPEEAPSRATAVRITGFWRWRNVIVPPNAYVVHTRRGKAEPLHVGLGVSFRFDPVTDTFLVVPATMQTIIINANCICRERQGVVVQGYVQWIIDDFARAYRKLDFSDAEEPMRVVNIQLREQAEAAIKDKVATMSIDDVLADKRPIIEELTLRLRHVAEGEGEDGLGLRIVTVQIKEAIVCSARLWEMLQRPFRAERAREARLAELASESAIREREAVEDKRRTELKIETETRAAELRAQAELDRAKAEAAARTEAIEHQRQRLALEGEIERLGLEHRLAMTAKEKDAAHAEELRALARLAERRRIDNDRSPEAVRMALVESLPQLAKELPKLPQLASLTVGEDALGALATAIGEAVRRREG